MLLGALSGCMHSQVYIGEEMDKTRNGGSIMGFMKSWRSLPIRSWSGGAKMADMPGALPKRLVTSALSTLLSPEVPLSLTTIPLSGLRD